MYRKLSEESEERAVDSGKTVDEIIHPQEFHYNYLEKPYKRTCENGIEITCLYSSEFNNNYQTIRFLWVQKIKCRLKKHKWVKYTDGSPWKVKCICCGVYSDDFCNWY